VSRPAEGSTMLDQIVAFVSKNKVMTAVAAAIVGLTL
jgi:hypothetical protein